MKTLKPYIIVISFFSILSGCATLVHGTKQMVAFETAQGGGNIVVYDDALYGIVSEYEGTLPATIELYRKKFYKIDVIHPQYGNKTIRIKPGYNYGDVLSNLFTVTMTIDTITGSSRSFDEKIIVDMTAPE